MPYQRVGARKVSNHQVRSPMLQVNSACQGCHRFEEAEPYLERSREGALREYGSQHRQALTARDRLIALYEAWGKPERADEMRQ